MDSRALSYGTSPWPSPTRCDGASARRVGWEREGNLELGASFVSQSVNVTNGNAPAEEVDLSDVVREVLFLNGVGRRRARTAEGLEPSDGTVFQETDFQFHVGGDGVAPKVIVHFGSADRATRVPSHLNKRLAQDVGNDQE